VSIYKTSQVEHFITRITYCLNFPKEFTDCRLCIEPSQVTKHARRQTRGDFCHFVSHCHDLFCLYISRKMVRIETLPSASNVQLSVPVSGSVKSFKMFWIVLVVLCLPVDTESCGTWCTSQAKVITGGGLCALGGPARSTSMGYVCLATCIHLPEKRRPHHVRPSRRKAPLPDREWWSTVT
jgi:hypothetical protein